MNDDLAFAPAEESKFGGADSGIDKGEI